jgi:hypothetical protein
MEKMLKERCQPLRKKRCHPQRNDVIDIEWTPVGKERMTHAEK